jgi:cation diffusion facilitator CzcD-associated flavoprotein CzcO
MPPTPPSQPRIAILGAGPAGLSTAWFLKKLGYTDVLVLEKLGRIGGLACTINSGYKAFDLGANYITPAYWETWKLAWAVGARTYKASVYSEAIERDDGFEYRPMTEYVRTDPNDPTKQVSLWRLGRAALKYFRLRLGVRKWIDRPDFGRVAERVDLCVSFEVWLDRNDLGVLSGCSRSPSR